MRIGLVSDHSLAHAPPLDTLRQCAEALHTRHGFDVSWLLATDTLAALAPALRPGVADDLPPTCRHVMPYALYRLEAARLIALESDVWQDNALHTRLFTLLRLMHREQPFAALHAWGALPTLYLTVYTAVYLRLPSAVFYTPACLQDGPRHAFLWSWVARHATIAYTRDAAERQRLLSASPLQPEQVQVLNAAQPDTIAALGRNFHHIAKNPFSL